MASQKYFNSVFRTQKDNDSYEIENTETAVLDLNKGEWMENLLTLAE